MGYSDYAMVRLDWECASIAPRVVAVDATESATNRINVTDDCAYIVIRDNMRLKIVIKHHCPRVDERLIGVD